MSSNCPFILIPVGKDYIWGGNRLRTEYGKAFIDLDPLAETWECSTHPEGESLVGSGVFKGNKLSTVLKEHPQFLGKRYYCSNGQLPFLIKFIDAKQDLSVQVHPNDQYANEYECGQLGKTEMWYVLDADIGASLVYGVNRVMSTGDLKEAVNQGTLMNYLNKVSVKAGDAFYIEAGTIHALGKGVLVAEIQETSNLTYRLYDYDRVDKDGKKRTLHLEKALAVANLIPCEKKASLMKVRRYMPGSYLEEIIKCTYFTVCRCIIKKSLKFTSNFESFRCLVVIEGNLKLHTEEFLDLRKGMTCFIPAGCESFEVIGIGACLIVSY